MVLVEVGAVIILATILAYISRGLKQPMILSYIAAGLILGPLGFGFIKNPETIKSFSEIGIAFLLFIAGLEINLKKIKEESPVFLTSGLIQIAMLFSTGFVIAIMMGFLKLEAIYIGLTLCFSSTMIAVKLLSDKGVLDTLHGRVVLGILLIEDLAAVLALLVLSTPEMTPLLFFYSLLKGAALFIFAYVFAIRLVPIIFSFAAKSQELFFLSSLGVLFLFSLAFHLSGFSVVIGGFVAGVVLGSSDYNLEVMSKIKPIKDFFSTLFFISLGLTLNVFNFSNILSTLIVLVLVIIIFKPIMITIFIKFFGYKTRTAFMTGISLAQISEFALVILLQGFSLGHISYEIFSLTILLAIISMTVSSYYLEHADGLYKKFYGILKVFDKIPHYRERLEYIPKRLKKPIIIFGGHRIGRVLIDTLKELKKDILVIDYDPTIINNLINERTPCIYGDVNSDDVLGKITFSDIVISTVPNKKDNLYLIKHVKRANPKSKVFVSSNNIDDAIEYYNVGADYIILPHMLSGQHISLVLKNLLQKKVSIDKLKRTNKKQLEKYFERFFVHSSHKL